MYLLNQLLGHDRLVPFLERVARWLPKEEVPKGTSDPMLIKHRLFNAFGWTFYLHLFCRSDKHRVVHNHAGAAVSLILGRGYREDIAMAPDAEGRCEVRSTLRLPGDFVQIPLGRYHRVELHNGPSWSLFARGPAKQVWHFLDPKRGVKIPQDQLDAYDAAQQEVN